MSSQDSQDTPYIFNRDFRSSIRLNYNHWWITQLCGYLLHPKIQYDQDKVRIADIGTGTAIWPLELASKLSPSARIDGFDISPSQYPPQVWCAENVKLITHDAFKPFPQEYLGKYDVVHIRFFCTLVNNEDAHPLLENLVALLKPGGYLQWFEAQVYASRAKPSDPAMQSTAVDRLAKMMHKPKPNTSYDWIEELPSSFEKHGLLLKTYDKIPMTDKYRLIWGQSNLAGLEDLAADSTVVGVEKATEVRRWMGQLSAEFAQGVSLDTPWLCVVGRKPT